LNGESTLNDLLNNDTECKAYLATTKLPAETFLPLYVINLLPAAVAVVALGWWAYTGELARAP
jgi:hypothetical protein